MTEQEILKKAIEKAVKNGWRPPFIEDIWEVGVSGSVWVFDKSSYNELIVTYKCEEIIFDHDFAKAFWNKEYGLWGDFKEWQHRLRVMVLEENPIRYLEKYL